MIIVKALTIREPWASLIVNGYKEYEFRSWKTNYRGKILIHAGKGSDKEYLDRFKEYDLEYGKGEIIGEAELVDCIKVSDEFQKVLNNKNRLVYGNNNYDQKYAWKLINIKKYDKRIPAKGKLSLWEYEINDDNT